MKESYIEDNLVKKILRDCIFQPSRNRKYQKETLKRLVLFRNGVA